MTRVIIALLALLLPASVMAQKQIGQFPAASSVAATDRIPLQQGVPGTPQTYGTVTQMLSSGANALLGTVGASGTITGTGSIIAGNGGSAPITLQSGIISVPTSQSLSFRVATAGQSFTFGAPAAGLGNALTITPNSNGNSLFGAAPNNVQMSNLLTVSRLTNTGITTALSGTATPTAITGNGSTVTITFPAISGVVIPVGSTVTLSGVTPGGYNKTYTVATSTTTQVTATDTTTGTVTVFGSMAYNMLSPYILNFTTNWTGTPIAGQRFSPYRFSIASDQSDTDGTGQGADVIEINHNWLGAAKGGKLGVQIGIAQMGATNDTGSQQHVVANLHAQASFNAGGTGTGLNAHGTLYGTNPQVRFNYGATRWALGNALGEVNLAVNSNRVDVTLGGTITAGNIVTLTFASADVVGSPVAVSWTVGAGQTLTTVGNNLEAAVNNNSALRNAKIAAVSRAGVVSVHYDTHLAALTLTPSTSGGATITAVAGSLIGGASVDNKIFASMIRLNDDDQPGSRGSGFLAMASQPDAAQSGRYDWGIGFGGFPTYNGTWPWHEGSTLIGAVATTGLGGTNRSGVIPPNVAKYGVDWRYVNFTQGSGLAFRSSNFSVDGTGVLALGGFTAVPSSAGMTLDMTGKTASAVTLASGGGGGGTAIGNFFIGDIGIDDNGGQYLVTGVSNTTGAVTTFTVLSYPSYSSGSAPTNPITVNAASGAGWTVNATWPSTVSLDLQTSGGDASFGGGLWVKGISTTGNGLTYAEHQLYGATSQRKLLTFYEENAGPVLRSQIGLNASNDFIIEQFNASGSSLGTALSFPNATGLPKFGRAGAWSANGSVATTMTSLGPTGAHTTVQKWFTIVDDGGVTRYIPAY